MRDFFVLTQLVLLEYDLLILWECEIKKKTHEDLSQVLTDFIYSTKKYEFINTKKKSSVDEIIETGYQKYSTSIGSVMSKDTT